MMTVSLLPVCAIGATKFGGIFRAIRTVVAGRTRLWILNSMRAECIILYC